MAFPVPFDSMAWPPSYHQFSFRRTSDDGAFANDIANVWTPGNLSNRKSKHAVSHRYGFSCEPLDNRIGQSTGNRLYTRMAAHRYATEHDRRENWLG